MYAPPMHCVFKPLWEIIDYLHIGTTLLKQAAAQGKTNNRLLTLSHILILQLHGVSSYRINMTTSPHLTLPLPLPHI